MLVAVIIVVMVMPIDDDDVDNVLSLVLEHLKLLIVCLDFGLQGRHYSLGHPELQLSESLVSFQKVSCFKNITSGKLSD